MSGSASGVGGGGGGTTVQQPNTSVSTPTFTPEAEQTFRERAEASGETPEEAEQNLRAAEKKWGAAFNTMFNQISVHQQLDTGLADEHPHTNSGSGGGGGGATGA